MQGHSDLYAFAAHFWWLVFPLGWGFAGLLRVIFHHHRAEQTLALLKSYADQGKEPPLELIQMLKEPVRTRRPLRDRSRGFLIAGMVFAALSVSFLALCLFEMRTDPDIGGLAFTVVLMAGFAVAMFIASFMFARDARLEKP